MILMRKISGISKWDGTNEVHRCDQFICGDALGDLKTTQNTLSDDSAVSVPSVAV